MSDGLRFEWKDDLGLMTCDVGEWHLRACGDSWNVSRVVNNTNIVVKRGIVPIFGGTVVAQRAAESALLSIAAEINAAAGTLDVNKELLEALEKAVKELDYLACREEIDGLIIFQSEIDPFRAVIAKAKGETT